ncbi:MAG: CPBP family intramembrane metalloprotease [Sphingomonadaceae bacterium]|nr:CPBP family intramembrane metalloprotease [Sphingomonadaceae bacterium]
MDGISEAARQGAIASRPHLIMLCLILLAIAAAGYLSLGRGGAGGALPTGAAIYLPLLAAEWGLFLYVRTGVRKRGHSIRALVSARPLGARTLLVDLLLAALLLLLLWAADLLLGRVLPDAPSGSVQALLVRRAADVPLWLLLSLSAGFVEEICFRGYLQRQLGALLAGPWLGVAAQALLFGISHGYQGPVPILRITIIGFAFGAMALLRRSLVPGIVAHAAMDVLGGLSAFR